VGSGAVLPGQCHICVGSSSWVIAHTLVRKLDVVHSVASLPSAIPGQYILMGEQESAGINLSWIRDNLLYHKDKLLQEESQPDVYKIFDSIVKEVEPGAKSVIFTPWLFGERAPVEDHTIRGGIHNLSLDIDRRHIIRAIYEGVAFNSRWLHMFEEKMLHVHLDPIHFIGGGAASDVWCQIYADVLGCTIRQVKNGKEANSIGASFIASVALNEITWEDIQKIVEFRADYKPNLANKAKYDTLFEEFVGLYYRNKKMYRRLNKFT